jgi:hypothetical protein
VSHEHPEAWKREALDSAEQDETPMGTKDPTEKLAEELATAQKNVADTLNEIWHEIVPGKIGSTRFMMMPLEAFEQLREEKDKWDKASRAFTPGQEKQS